jgi:hypothetical protein
MLYRARNLPVMKARCLFGPIAAKLLRDEELA